MTLEGLGFGPNGFVRPDHSFPYTIDFQNKPTATGPAQHIVITQQLDPDLDLNTFQLGDFGFGGLTVSVPAGRQFYSTRVDLRSTRGLFVDVTADLDRPTRTVTWTFTAIDPATLDLPADPFIGFLPPDQNAPEGEGFVTYSILPQAADPTGTVINAKATVVFDANAPIDTPLIFNTIDAGPPTSTVAALPPFEPAGFTVRWSGSDDPGGSGIASFDVYVSDNGGPFTPYLLDTTQTSAPFTGQDGHTYAFYCVATDNVGHQEVPPTTAQASTTVDAIPPTSTVAPLPATTASTSFTVRWSGSDNPGGSGLAFYDVFVSDNGAAFTAFLTATTLTSSTFTGQSRHTYGFYSVATDNVGNRQATPAGAQATTQVSNPTVPPTESYQVNDGSAQRSAVSSLTVTFSTRVDVGAGAFQLTQRQPGAAPLDLSGLLRLGIALNSQGSTVVTLTFVGSGVVGGSLPDGWFTLTTIGVRVHDHATGAALDGAGTGVAGSNQVDAFFRLFGDVTGDGQVDDRDRTAFLAAYRSRRGMSNYRWYFDYNNDGLTDSIDYYQFLRRYKTRLNSDGSVSSIP